MTQLFPSAGRTEHGTGPRPVPPARRGLPARASAVVGLALLGLAVSVVTGHTVVLAAPLVALWCVVAVARLGTRPVLTGAMMAAAVTAPMNGIRVPGDFALTDVFLVVGAVALLAERIGDGSEVAEGRPRGVPAVFCGGLAMVVVGGALGTFFAVAPATSLLNLLRFSLSAALPVIVVCGWRPEPGTVRRYVWCWVAGASASGLVALTSVGDASGRSAGLTTHPNHLAMISALGAGLALGLTAAEDGVRRWVAGGCYALLALTVVRAGSRAGLVAVLVTTVVVAVRTRSLRPRPTRPGRLALVGYGFTMVMLTLLVTNTVKLGQHNAIRRLLGDATATSSDQGRAGLLRLGIRSIGARPLTGSGFANALQAHNIYVQLWAAAGIVGLVGFLVLAFATVRAGLETPSSRPESWLPTAFVAGYIGYLAAGTVQNFLWDRYLWLHVALILWVSARARIEPRPAERCA